MATLKFYLKEPNKQNLHPVFMCYQDKGRKFRFSTKVQTTKAGWQENRIKAVSMDDYESNERLETCEKVIKGIEKEGIQGNRKFSVQEVEEKFRERVFKTPCYSMYEEGKPCIAAGEAQTPFFDFYDQFIEASKPTKAATTISHYVNCKRILMNFQKALGRTISFSIIDNSFYQKFQTYMIEELSYLNNTVGGHSKNLKVFLNYAMRQKFTDLKFEYWDFKTFKEDIDIIALTDTELFKIYSFKSLNENQDIARDYLCFECFTGLRFSDIARLKNENIKDDYIILRTQKTKDQLYIPLNVFAKEILEKYKGMYNDSPLPPSFSNQKINFYIKEVAELVKINDLVMVEKFSGSTRLSITKPKYAFVTTHTGRRTFITLSHEKGMQIEMIMKITGIRKWDTLKKYLKVSDKNKLNKMNEFWNRDMFNTENKITKPALCI